MKIIKKSKLTELVGGDMNSAGGDKPFSNDSEIETGPVEKPNDDNSDYEKGMATTGDRVFGRYRQNIPWFAVYSFGGSRSGRGIRAEGAKTVITKKAMEERIEDLVKKTKINSDVTDKNYNPKVAKLIDTINDNDLTEKQMDEVNKFDAELKMSNKIDAGSYVRSVIGKKVEQVQPIMTEFFNQITEGYKKLYSDFVKKYNYKP